MRISATSKAALFYLAVLCLPAVVNPQSPPPTTVIPELTATDPDIRALLSPVDGSCKQQNPDESLDRLKKALRAFDGRGLVGDRALVEAALGSVLTGQGNLEMASLAFQRALEDAKEAKNEVLEADMLIAIASEAQVKGNIKESMNLVSQALSMSERNGNLYEKAHALGELGRLNLLTGKASEGGDQIDEALKIDKLNAYKFEALHLVYKGFYLGGTGKEDQAIETLSDAKTKAIATTNAFAFVMAENSYAFGIARKGRADNAIDELESVRKGELQPFVRDPKERDCLTSAIAVPIFRVLVLEGLATVLRVADKKEKEIDVWRELFSMSRDLDLVAGEAEAEQKIGELENQLKKPEDALRDYTLAASLYRSTHNEGLLNQVEISQSLLLIQLGRGMEAVPLENEIASYAHNNSLRGPEFYADGVLGEIYQTAGDLASARDALEKAASLIRPGPFDDEIANSVVHQDYVRLSNIYRGLGSPQRELVSIDKAFFVSVHLKDEKSQQAEVEYLNQRLNELHIREAVEKRQKDGQLAESLLYSYILFIHDGFPSKPTDDQSNWQRILTLPFQITRQSGGAVALKEILHDIGPLVVGFNRLPILSALSRYYVMDGADPLLAERYALESEGVLKDVKGDMTSLQAEAACVLAISYSRQGNIGMAKKRIEECTSLAKKAGDQPSIDYSDAANILVESRLGNITAAEGSLENVIARAPDNPELLVELAMAVAGAKLYDKSNSELERAIQKLVSAGDKRGAAMAYGRVAFVLNGDSTETAQKLQLQYLESARQLYHGLGAQADEAEMLVVLGDYRLKLVQTKPGLDYYEQALNLAQKAGKPEIVAEGLLGLGNGYKAQRDFNQAAENHRKAAAAFHNVSNSEREAICLEDLAADYYELGDTDQALASFLDAKKLTQNATAFSRYLVEYRLGDFYRSLGQFEKALASLNEAVDITTQAGDLEHSGYSHLAIAALDTVIGSWDDARSESQIALDLFQTVGSKEGQAACWALLTGVYCDRSSSLKDFDKSQECYAKARELGFGKTIDLDFMEMYLQTGKYVEAAKIANESIADCQKNQDAACQAHALLSLSQAVGLEGDLRGARAALNRARPIATKSPELYLRGRFLYTEAKLFSLEGNLPEAVATYRELISLIETVKGGLNAQEQKSLAENYGYIYDELVSLLYSMSERAPASRSKLASESFEYAEINKARQFAASWGRVFVNQMRPTLPAATQEREQSLYSKRDRLLVRLEARANNDVPNPENDTEHLKADLLSVQGEIKDFLTDLRKTSPQYAAIAYPEETRISTLPLKKGETLVEFKMTNDATFVWVIRNDDGSRNELAAFYKVSQKRDWFLDRLSALRKGLNSGRPGAVDWKIEEALFAQLFPGDVAKMVSGSQEIIFVPDDVLFILPFELFSPDASKGDFVFLKKATTYYPSAASLRLARTARHQSGWEESFLGIADPITPSPDDDRFVIASALKAPETTLSQKAQDRGGEQASLESDKLKSRGFSFERLPGTATEVESIAALLRARNETVEVRLGASATKGEILDTDLSKFRFVHFATHGVSPVDTGIKEPFLVLSYDGVDLSRMRLSMSEIIGLKLRSDSVVLSACNTGSGTISRAEGVMSLGRAFLAAGSSSVTVSLWQVSDESTAVLMKNYYEGLLQGKKKSVALAGARHAVFANGDKDPFFWAPFIVMGE
jgi:CHAT domain-containing protein/tetratricopeptide (TPR) repeat protein